MDAVSTFFDMGGYAVFVWPGYGLAGLALIGLLVITLRGLKTREREFSEVRRNRPEPGAMP
jgi:heme exporter protein D